MRILSVAGYGVRLGASGNSFVVKSSEGERKIPVWEVDVVIIASSGVSVSSRAMRLMISSGVEMVVLNGRGDPVGILYSSHYTRTPDTRRAQYSALHSGLGVEIARSIAVCKLNSQAHHLKSLAARTAKRSLLEGAGYIASKARELLEADLGPDVQRARKTIMGLEAEAAREYWGSIALVLPEELGFDGRDRDSGDPVNACLNYGYGILYSISWRNLVLAGLDPYAGFLHVDRSGKPVLSFDYVELFRAPLVDEPVVGALLRGWKPSVDGGRLSPRDRNRIVELMNRKMKAKVPGAFRHMSYEEALKSYALRLAKALRGESGFMCPGRGGVM